MMHRRDIPRDAFKTSANTQSKPKYAGPVNAVRPIIRADSRRGYDEKESTGSGKKGLAETGKRSLLKRKGQRGGKGRKSRRGKLVD